jgi:hypothetical protein
LIACSRGSAIAALSIAGAGFGLTFFHIRPPSIGALLPSVFGFPVNVSVFTRVNVIAFLSDKSTGVLAVGSNCPVSTAGLNTTGTSILARNMTGFRPIISVLNF